MKSMKLLVMLSTIAVVSITSEALLSGVDKKLDDFLFQLLNMKKPDEQRVSSDQCTAVIYGTLAWQSSKFPTIRFGLKKDFSAPPDISICYFIVSAMEETPQALDKVTMEFASVTRKNPNLVVRINMNRKTAAQETPNNTSMATAAHSKALSSSLEFPTVYLRLTTFKFILTRHCRKPRRGIWLSAGQISFMDPDASSLCTLRIGYNNMALRFVLKEDHSLDMNAKESLYLQTYLEVSGVKGTFVNGNSSWGSLDPVTGRWTGVVGMTMDKEVDVSTTFIGYTAARASVIDYSHYVGPAFLQYYSKFPEKQSPIGNIIKVFDGYSWLLILISLILLWTLIYLAANWSGMIGSIPGFLEIVMNANPCAVATPNWTNRIKTKKITIAVLLATANLSCFILAKAFGCNLNAILMKSESAKAINHACDIVEQKKTMLFYEGTWHQAFMETSPDPCQAEAAKNSEIFPKDLGLPALYYRIATDPNVIHTNSEDVVMGLANGDPRYRDLPKPWFHWSKGTFRPYYTGWVLTKNSVWMEKINKHLLRCHQAGFDIKLDKFNLERLGQRENELRPLMLEHFAVGYCIMLIGFILGSAAFLKEMITKKSDKIMMANTGKMSPYLN